MLGIGISASVESVQFNGGKPVDADVRRRHGHNVIANLTIAFSIPSLINLPGNALGSASTIIVGRRLGRRDQSGELASPYFLAIDPWADRHRLGHGTAAGIRRVYTSRMM